MPQFSRSRLNTALLVLALLLGLASALPQRPAQAVGEPGAGTVVGQQAVSLYSAALTGSGSGVTSASPRVVSGSRDQSDVRYWNDGVLYVSADFATTGTVTATVQFSVDQAGWANATYSYVAGSTLTTATRRVVITGDGTGYTALPIEGRFIRVSLDRTASVTPTVTLWLRNSGGS